MNNFEHTQQALEIALAYIDNLTEQGKSRSEALDHAVQRFGVSRSRLMVFLNERDYGLMGTSGETEMSVVSTESTPIGV